MQSRNRVFDDAARVAGGAFGVLSGIRSEVEGMVRHQIDKLLTGMDLVPQDEFDVVKAMAIRAREENERLEERLEVLEKAFEKTASASRSKQKTSAKGSVSKKG